MQVAAFTGTRLSSIQSLGTQCFREMMNKPISIVFVITNLDCGGAEVMLLRLLSRLDQGKFTAQVISLIETGQLGRQIEALGVPVRALGMRRGRPSFNALIRLAIWLRQDRPQLVQTWMYHADLLGSIAAWLAGGIPVTWGIHQSDLSWAGNRFLTLLTVKVCACLSWLSPKHIICCSEASKQAHQAAGYVAEKLVTIPDGYDVDTFKPDDLSRTVIRAELDVPEDMMVIGMVARAHPQKDYPNLLRAARVILRERRDVCFVLCGHDVTWENEELTALIESADREQFRLLGQREDIPRVMAAFDVATLSSFGEAFPNVISEAMSCGVPCVVTDVGDAALIVGDTGIVVPTRDPVALAEGWSRMLDLGREARARLGLAARERIKEHYNVSKFVGRYEALYEMTSCKSMTV